MSPTSLFAFRLRLTLLLTPVLALLWSLCAQANPIELQQAQKYYLPVHALVLSDTAPEASASRLPQRQDLVPIESGNRRNSVWYRYDLNNRSEADLWHLLVTNTLLATIDVYTSTAGEQDHSRNGYLQHIPFDLSNGVPLQIPRNALTSIWINVQSPHVSPILLISLIPDAQYPQQHFNYSSMILIAIGAMLALVIYNAFLYFPTRDEAFIWYAGYQLLCVFAWAMQFKVALYCCNLPLEPATLYLPFFIAGAASLMFAISFLRLPQGGWLALLVRACAIALVVFGLLGLLLPVAIYQLILLGCTYTWLVIMLGLGIWRLYRGYRPARIYVIGFGILATYFLFTLVGNVLGTTLFDNQLLWALWAQLFDAVALALALADRINFLRKSRLHADKRASTDQLTGLPNRAAFERDVRAWEAYYTDGVIQDFFLTFIDVDGLKQVNDAQGHNEGDRLLTLVARWLLSQTQHENVYRIGGDEFVVLTRHQISWNLSSLRMRLAEEGFPKSDLSIGTSCYTECGNRSSLLKLADERMYAIKHSNR